jgi:hypothetical protein
MDIVSKSYLLPNFDIWFKDMMGDGQTADNGRGDSIHDGHAQEHGAQGAGVHAQGGEVMGEGERGRGEEGQGRVTSGVCIYIPGYVYIPFADIWYVKGMFFSKKVCI